MSSPNPQNRLPFWGENFRGARSSTPWLDNPAKLVYSPHVYGPSVYSNKPYFNTPGWCAKQEPKRSGCTNDFPHNLGRLVRLLSSNSHGASSAWKRSSCALQSGHSTLPSDGPPDVWLSSLQWGDNFWDQRGDVPIVIGEFGGWYGDFSHSRHWDPTGENGPIPDDRDVKDKRFQDYAMAWFVQHSVGVFYFGL